MSTFMGTISISNAKNGGAGDPGEDAKNIILSSTSDKISQKILADQNNIIQYIRSEEKENWERGTFEGRSPVDSTYEEMQSYSETRLRNKNLFEVQRNSKIVITRKGDYQYQFYWALFGSNKNYLGRRSSGDWVTDTLTIDDDYSKYIALAVKYDNTGEQLLTEADFDNFSISIDGVTVTPYKTVAYNSNDFDPSEVTITASLQNIEGSADCWAIPEGLTVKQDTQTATQVTLIPSAIGIYSIKYQVQEGPQKTISISVEKEQISSMSPQYRQISSDGADSGWLSSVPPPRGKGVYYSRNEIITTLGRVLYSESIKEDGVSLALSWCASATSTYFDGANIAANTITASQIAANTITASEIATNAITANKILVNAITTDKIATNAITTDKIAANAITASKIAADLAFGNYGTIDFSNGTFRFWSEETETSPESEIAWVNGELAIKGNLTATGGEIGGWLIGDGYLYSGSSTSYVGLGTSGDYRIWAGDNDAANAPFSVQKDGILKSMWKNAPKDNFFRELTTGEKPSTRLYAGKYNYSYRGFVYETELTSNVLVTQYSAIDINDDTYFPDGAYSPQSDLPFIFKMYNFSSLGLHTLSIEESDTETFESYKTLRTLSTSFPEGEIDDLQLTKGKYYRWKIKNINGGSARFSLRYNIDALVKRVEIENVSYFYKKISTDGFEMKSNYVFTNSEYNRIYKQTADSELKINEEGIYLNNFPNEVASMTLDQIESFPLTLKSASNLGIPNLKYFPLKIINTYGDKTYKFAATSFLLLQGEDNKAINCISTSLVSFLNAKIIIGDYYGLYSLYQINSHYVQKQSGVPSDQAFVASVDMRSEQEGTPGKEVFYSAIREDKNTAIAFGVGSGGENHGLWSYSLGKTDSNNGSWMLYAKNPTDTSIAKTLHIYPQLYFGDTNKYRIQIDESTKSIRVYNNQGENQVVGIAFINTGSLKTIRPTSDGNVDLGSDGRPFSNGYFKKIYFNNVSGGYWYKGHENTRIKMDATAITNSAFTPIFCITHKAGGSGTETTSWSQGILGNNNNFYVVYNPDISQGSNHTSSIAFVSDGTMYAQGFNTPNSSSDINVKNSISILPQEYDILFDKLKPCRYKYNFGESNRYHTGFIAQEIVTALEESGLTTQDLATVDHLQEPMDNGSEWILHKEELVALNTWQIQKLKARVFELEQKIQQLEAKEI